MILAPGKGFVFLAIPKTASTSIERALMPHTHAYFTGNPFKHTRYSEFQRFLQPFLASKGFPRDSYEVVCVFREPIDWLFSWYRYRTREELKGYPNYCGHVSFEEFARAYIEGKERFARVGRPSRFVRPRKGGRGVDLIFRYERIDLLVEYLCEKVGREVEVEISNVSPEREFSLSREREQALREFFLPEYRIYEKAIGA
ncbi:conserved hypothetical protein [Rubrobacter xylanophilus DSM 9941]|mgnify:CR=1 FL=1|uniref:Gamma-glutamyl kinase n=1 Tax=Rubrobacter xylanophilus (strain DSM 9941 / JCM 11954 / NBRC 16129 / PRD-1) TaxID=266117 RepID=Q1ARH2_RUBXD|nr:sulfotransferase family 2 domain-containing protein [Rubrobacter xylanophilus]ABG06006.1 conserved hypothetical protein [Rubrobacter xylanophilus DSM 9941]